MIRLICRGNVYVCVYVMYVLIAQMFLKNYTPLGKHFPEKEKRSCDKKLDYCIKLYLQLILT